MLIRQLLGHAFVLRVGGKHLQQNLPPIKFASVSSYINAMSSVYPARNKWTRPLSTIVIDTLVAPYELTRHNLIVEVLTFKVKIRLLNGDF